MSVNDGNTVSDEVRKRLLDGLEMRKHTAAEFDALAQMNKELIEDEESRNPMSVAELRERLERYVNDEGWTLDVFVSEGQTVGYITFRYEANPVGPNCQTVHLKQFYISRNTGDWVWGQRRSHCLGKNASIRETVSLLKFWRRIRVAGNFGENLDLSHTQRSWNTSSDRGQLSRSFGCPGDAEEPASMPSTRLDLLLPSLPRVSLGRRPLPLWRLYRCPRYLP